MNQDRLLEICSTVNTLDGPNIVLGYLSSLSESDVYLFLSYVRRSKYKDLNFYDAVKNFSADYIKDKPILEDNPALKRLSFLVTSADFSYDYGFNANYINQTSMDDDSFKIVDGGIKK